MTLADDRSGAYSLRMKRVLISGAVAIAVGFPIGWIFTMLATPFLWKLEPVLHMELAGHSGPSDWVFLAGWGIVIPAMFAIVYVLLRCSEPASGTATPRNGH
jgi:hypothetical protein